MNTAQYYRDKKILIAGGLGFLGSNLAIKLVEYGAVVTILDGLLENLGGNFFNIQPIENEVNVVIGNLSDRSCCDFLIRDQDLIFNSAMHSSHIDSMKKPLYDLETNIIPQFQFLESIRQTNPTVRIVYIGSRAQFGKVKKLPISEDSLPFPADIYAAGKQVVEWYHLLYGQICGLRTTSLRLGNTYGPRHQMKHAKYGVQNYLLRQALDSEEIQVYGQGSQLREMIYVDDVVEALLLLAHNDRTIGEYYCIGSSETVSFVDLVREIIAATGSGSYRHVPWPEEREIIEVGDVQTDFSKLIQHTGWQPKTTLGEGLRRTAAYYKKYGQRYW